MRIRLAACLSALVCLLLVAGCGQGVPSAGSQNAGGSIESTGTLAEQFIKQHQLPEVGYVDNGTIAKETGGGRTVLISDTFTVIR